MTTVKVGEFDFDETSGSLGKDGVEAVRLSSRATEVLKVLIASGGTVISRRHLHETVWSGRVVTDVQVSKAISELRSGFQDEADDPAYIETLPRRGYRLLQPVISAKRGLSRNDKQKITIKKIEVLGEFLEPLASIIRQDLIHEVSKTPLQVVSSTLGSPYFEITGSLRRIRGGLQLSLQVITSADGHVLWSKQLEESSTLDRFSGAEYFAHMTRRIVDFALTMERQRTTKVAGHECMMAQIEFEELSQGSGGNWGAMKRHLLAALEADPEFTSPLFLLVLYYKNRYGDISYEEAVGPAHEYAQKLLASQPNATFTLGTINSQLDLDYTAAIANIDHDRQNNATRITLGEYESEIGLILCSQGKVEEAIVHLETATSLDKGSNRRSAILQLAEAHFVLGHYTDMQQCLDELVGQPENFRVLANKTYANYYLSCPDEAEESLDRIWAMYGSKYPYSLCGLLALLGKIDTAVGILEEAEERFSNDIFVASSSCFWCCFHLNRIDEAMVWLHRAIENREINLFPHLHRSKLLAGIRDDPRFVDAMRYLKDLESIGTRTKSVAYPKARLVTRMRQDGAAK